MWSRWRTPDRGARPSLRIGRSEGLAEDGSVAVWPNPPNVMPLSSANRLFQGLIRRGTSQLHSGPAYFTHAFISVALLVGNQAEQDGGKPLPIPMAAHVAMRTSHGWAVAAPSGVGANWLNWQRPPNRGDPPWIGWSAIQPGGMGDPDGAPSGYRRPTTAGWGSDRGPTSSSRSCEAPGSAPDQAWSRGFAGAASSVPAGSALAVPHSGQGLRVAPQVRPGLPDDRSTPPDPLEPCHLASSSPNSFDAAGPLCLGDSFSPSSASLLNRPHRSPNGESGPRTSGCRLNALVRRGTSQFHSGLAYFTHALAGPEMSLSARVIERLSQH